MWLAGDEVSTAGAVYLPRRPETATKIFTDNPFYIKVKMITDFLLPHMIGILD